MVILRILRLWCSGYYVFLSCEVSYVFGVVDIFFCIFTYSSVLKILLDEVENITKNPANIMRATLACLLTCLCIAHVLSIPFINEKKKPKSLNVAYKIGNLSKI